MKVLISERQLRRLIREFYENEYIDIIPNITDEIIDNVFVKSDGLETLMEGVKKILENRFGEYFSIKNNKDKFNLLKKLIVDNFETRYRHLRFCDIPIAGYRIEDNNNWNRGMPESHVFEPNPTGLKKAVVKFFEILKNKFPKELEGVQQKIDVSDYEHTPFTHAGELPKEEGEDDLKQKIYDWEYTKDLLERLLLKYIHMEQYVDEEAFKIITKHRIIEKMFNRMDDHMKRGGYKLFGIINRINLDSDFSKFIIAYKEYFKFIDNLEYSPYKVFIGLVEGMKNKTKFELKK